MHKNTYLRKYGCSYCPTPPPEEYYPSINHGFSETLASIIINYLHRVSNTVSCDEVADEVISLARSMRPGTDERVVGLPFSWLSRRGYIAKTGQMKKSERASVHHQLIAIWAKTEKFEQLSLKANKAKHPNS